MDKRIIFAVAGSGKTTYLINQLDNSKRSLIITYTNNNIKNIRNGVINKFGFIPDNITIVPYFSFLYSFCFKPFLSYGLKTKGVNYNSNPNLYLKKTDSKYYFDRNRLIYSNRISKILIEKDVIKELKKRIEKYFDNLFIDEIQDFGGNDFNFLKNISQTNINHLYVGDFFQHTFDTSRDGNTNKNLHKDIESYFKKFEIMGFEIDTSTLLKSYRCSPSICNFLSENLGINIESHKSKITEVKLIEDIEELKNIFFNNSIIKLFLQKHYTYNCQSLNWGDSKGENQYNDICVVLNPTTFSKYSKNSLNSLAPLTKNKFYVACSRANRNLFFVNQKLLEF